MEAGKGPAGGPTGPQNFIISPGSWICPRRGRRMAPSGGPGHQNPVDNDNRRPLPTPGSSGRVNITEVFVTVFAGCLQSCGFECALAPDHAVSRQGRRAARPAEQSMRCSGTRSGTSPAGLLPVALCMYDQLRLKKLLFVATAPFIRQGYASWRRALVELNSIDGRDEEVRLPCVRRSKHEPLCASSDGY